MRQDKLDHQIRCYINLHLLVCHCFLLFYSVQFDEGNQHIMAMKSLEGEVVPLKNKVQITPDVEVFLR